MAWSLNTDTTPSINDSALLPIPVGTHTYKVVAADLAPAKKGEAEMAVFLKVEANGVVYTNVIRVMSTNEVAARIAAQTVSGLAKACGMKGVFTSERLKSLKGHYVEIHTEENNYTAPNGTTREGSNIKTIHPGHPPEATPAPAPAPPPEAEVATPVEYSAPEETPLPDELPKAKNPWEL